MVAWNLGPTWADQTRTYGRSARMPIVGTLRRETEKGFLIEAALRSAWVPKRLVSHDPEKGVFTMPMWLANEKRLR